MLNRKAKKIISTVIVILLIGAMVMGAAASFISVLV